MLPLPVLGGDGLLNAPFSRREVTLGEILDQLHPGQVVCGGLLSKDVVKEAEGRGLRMFDYYEREECKIANAVPTALSVVQLQYSLY